MTTSNSRRGAGRTTALLMDAMVVAAGGEFVQFHVLNTEHAVSLRRLVNDVGNGNVCHYLRIVSIHKGIPACSPTTHLYYDHAVIERGIAEHELAIKELKGRRTLL